jgi:hypothetical protein
MSSLELCKLGSLVYPIMLTQEAGELTEAKAAELIGLDIVSYREAKAKAIQSILGMVESLPSPLILLLEGTKVQQPSSTQKDAS